MYKVLIAHQSTIPHYRVPFYNSLEKLKPDNWQFDVVFDFSELENPRFFKEEIDPNDFSFSTLKVHTYQISIKGKVISYQTFFWQASRYDLIILEHAFNNLTYPLCQLLQPDGTKIALWGHGRDRSIEGKSFPHKIKGELKQMFVRKSDGYFAYTRGSKSYLEKHGLSSEDIFVVNNTIDIKKQRKHYLKIKHDRDEIRNQKGFQDKKVLLFVGRLKKDKSINILIDTFIELYNLDPTFYLILIGRCGEAIQIPEHRGIEYLGSIVDLNELGPYYIASDLFIIPGAVGLGPIQALCFDLPILTIDSPYQKPEFEYLSSQNSIILDPGSSQGELVQAIQELFNDVGSINRLRANAWASINYLTIENMAQNFISGVNNLLEQ